MPCQMCIKRGKTWNGGDPKCAFEGGQRFWNGETWLYNVRTDKGDAVCCSRNMLAGGQATERI